MARELNDKVLEGRIGRFRALLRDLDPVLQQLGDNRKRLTDLVNSLVTFTEKIPRASYDGQLLLYPILRIVWPDGTPIFPGLQRAAAEEEVRRDTGAPDELQGALPDLNELLEPRR